MRVVSFFVVMILLVLPATAALAEGAELRILAPMQGETVVGNMTGAYLETPGLKITPSTVKLEEAGKHPEANRPGEGHIHLMLDLQPLVVWDKAEPYVFNNIPPGEHVLMVELVENDHSSFNPPLVEQVRFTAVNAPLATAPIPSIMPNTGIAAIGSMPSTYGLLALSGVLVVAGIWIRRRAV